jgi:hypothetical protein
MSASDKSTITIGLVVTLIAGAFAFLTVSGILSFKPAEAATAQKEDHALLMEHDKRIQHIEDAMEYMKPMVKETNDTVKEMAKKGR